MPGPAGQGTLSHTVPRILPCLVVLVAVLAACTAGEPDDAASASPDVAATSPSTASSPTPTGTATATPTPTPPPTPTLPPPAAPVEVVVAHIQLTPTSHGEIVGLPEPQMDTAVAEAMVERGRQRLQAFLDAQFVAADTRFSAEGVAALVDPALLTPADLAGLGVLAPDVEVLGTRTGTAHARAEILLDGAVVHSVALTYSATTELVLADAEGTVVHEGRVAFVELDGTLETAALEGRTTFGGDLGDVVQLAA